MKVCSLYRALAHGFGEGKFVGGSKGIEVQAFLVLLECLRKKVCECKIPWHLLLVKEVLNFL